MHYRRYSLCCFSFLLPPWVTCRFHHFLPPENNTIIHQHHQPPTNHPPTTITAQHIEVSPSFVLPSEHRVPSRPLPPPVFNPTDFCLKQLARSLAFFLSPNIDLLLAFCHVAPDCIGTGRRSHTRTLLLAPSCDWRGEL